MKSTKTGQANSSPSYPLPILYPPVTEGLPKNHAGINRSKKRSRILSGTIQTKWLLGERMPPGGPIHPSLKGYRDHQFSLDNLETIWDLWRYFHLLGLPRS